MLKVSLMFGIISPFRHFAISPFRVDMISNKTATVREDIRDGVYASPRNDTLTWNADM